MVSFTLVCPIERIENRIKKIDDSGFITSGFLALIVVEIFFMASFSQEKIVTNSRISFLKSSELNFKTGLNVKKSDEQITTFS
jgi:hypothetical protein